MNPALLIASGAIGNEPIVAISASAVDTDDFIKSRIYTIRGVQVMLDRDLAAIYGVETKVLNQAVKRNAERFPASFMFQLSSEETNYWKSHFVTSNLTAKEEAGVRMGLRRPPYAFTEQGIAMLSAVLKSKTAILVSVRIMEVFVAMRRALASIAPMLARIDTVERRQITDQARNEERFDTIFKAMEGGDFPTQKVFFEGKHYDAYSFARKLVRKAMKRINGELYHLGASLKDLGRQYCAVTKMDAMFIPSIMQRI